MQNIVISNISCPLAPKIIAQKAQSFWQRFIGFMFHPPITSAEGLLIDEGENSRVNTAIHMFFMRFNIAAIWINDSFEVVDVRLAKKWQAAILPAAPARYILETHVDRIHDFLPGDRISIEEI